jgi:hypothetical protein
MNFRPYHNPENIDESLVPDGWRFRYADEMKTRNPKAKYVYEWDGKTEYSSSASQGRLPYMTYIVPVNS